MSVLIRLDSNTVVEVEPPQDPKDGPRLRFYVYEREACVTAAAAEALAALLHPADPKERT